MSKNLMDKLSFRAPLSFRDKWILSFAIVTLSVALKYFLIRHTESQLFFISVAAVFTCALYCGFGFGLGALFLTVVTHTYFFIEHEFVLHLYTSEEIREMLLYAVTAFFGSLVGGRLHAANEATRLAVLDRENLMAILSHDLRNPIAVVKLATELLMRKKIAPGDEAMLQRQLNSIHRSADTMDRLISSILDVERAKSGKLELRLGPVPIKDLFGRVQDLMRAVAERKEQTLKFEIESDSGEPLVFCDSDRILQVFSNLVGNAVKYSPAGSMIRVQAKVDSKKQNAVFSVTDAGPGISEEDRKEIFEKGWQKKANSGVGLGLWIADSIARAHKSEIKVENAPGGGSRFYFELASPAVKAYAKAG